MANRIGEYGQVLPGEQYVKQEQEMAKALMPIVQSILVGEASGITPRAAEQLMGIFTPQVLGKMYDRGMEVNPNWYQNYITPGSVGPDRYARIMGYSRGFADLPEEALQAGFTSQWGPNPAYVYGGGGAPKYKQQLMQRAIDRERLGMEALGFDPFTGEVRATPDAERSALQSYLEATGMEPSLIGDDAGAVERFLRAIGLSTSEQYARDNKAAYDAQVLKVDQDTYNAMVAEIESLMAQGLVDEYTIRPVLIENGINVELLDALNPWWWEKLKKTPRIRPRTTQLTP